MVERPFDFMPRWPKPHIKAATGAHETSRKWVVIFGDLWHPHVRYSTGHHAKTVSEAWAHLPAMMDYHGVARAL